MWVDLSSQIAADFAQWPGVLDAAEGLTIRGPDLLDRHRVEGFLEHVAAVAGEREEWTMPELLRALGAAPSDAIRVGLALRVLGGWTCRRRRPRGVRVYRRRALS